MIRFKLILFFLALLVKTTFSQNFPYKIGRVDDDENMFNDNPCDVKIKVIDERPIDCDFNGNYYFFPVYVEEFNYLEDLPNNWAFNYGYTLDDHPSADDKGKSWMASPYGTNVYTSNSKCVLDWKKEYNYASPNPNQPPHQYDFTGGILNSIFKLRQGVFEARIKLPENANFSPAFWITDHQEIDIFEFYDDDLDSKNTCDTYHMMKMNIHGYKNPDGSFNNSRQGTHCNRNRKFGVNEDFFDDYHIYKCVWTDYKIQIYLDGTLVAYATKYYDGPFLPSDPCTAYAASGVPSWTRDCNYMSTADGCNSWFFDECLDYNKVYKDYTFPSTNKPMGFLISNAVNHNHNQNLVDSWDNYSIDDKRIQVDWVKIYQPMNCSWSFAANNEGQLKVHTQGTNFMSGHDITISTGLSNNVYINEAPSQNNNWHNFPTHLLATEAIAILNDTYFEQGTFLRAEIVDCSGGFNQYQRTTGEEKLFLSDLEIAELEKARNIENGIKEDNDKGIKYEKSNAIIENSKKQNLSLLDNGAITIFPNPVSNILNLVMDDEDYFDLIGLTIINSLGQEISVIKNKTIDVSGLDEGFYKIKFVFSSGRFVYKKFIKSNNN